MIRTCLLVLAGLLTTSWVGAAEVRVAVASNFSAPMQQIAQAFNRQTGHRAVLAFGATGTLRAQISHGAPFEVLLAADEETPRQLEAEGAGVPGSRFTYAIGRLVLWSSEAGVVDDAGRVLHDGDFRRLAIANPRVAPYGRAAMETMSRLGVLPRLQSRLVQGDSIAQTHQFVLSGNADIGFVALSQVQAGLTRGSAWVVPAGLHEALRQDALLLQAGKDNPAAAALLAFLRSEAARSIVLAHGYAP